MTERSEKKLGARKLTIRGEKDIKSMKKDVKTICSNFINHHLFVYMHMVYMRVFQVHQIGAPAQELAKFYHAIATVPACSKLNQFLLKHNDFKEEFTKVLEMFGDGSHSGSSSASVSSVSILNTSSSSNPNIATLAPSASTPNVRATVGAQVQLSQTTGRFGTSSPNMKKPF